jgi:ABC-type antimicrobial peptide transport system permease subunit
LGADRARIVNLVIKEAVILLTAGLVIGAGLAAAMARTATSLLYGLRPTDPTTMAGAVVTLAFIAMLASIIPAFRASRVEPMTALREE